MTSRSNLTQGPEGRDKRAIRRYHSITEVSAVLCERQEEDLGQALA
jgi:hypothetical protein